VAAAKILAVEASTLFRLSRQPCLCSLLALLSCSSRSFTNLSCLVQSTLNYSIFPIKNFKRLNVTSNCYSLSIGDELAIVSCICIYDRISSFPADVFPATQLRHHRHSAEVQVEGRTTLPRQAESCRCPGYEASRNKGRTWNIERTSRQGVDIGG